MALSKLKIILGNFGRDDLPVVQAAQQRGPTPQKIRRKDFAAAVSAAFE
jgi:hypothetical protein